MRHWKITKWCDIAAKKIRYTPDREAVCEELRQHLDERSDSFLARGMTEEEAVEKTLEVMGSPDELSVILGQIHRPYWGFAYSITKVMAKVMVIAALVLFAWNTAGNLIGQEYTQLRYSVYHPYQDTTSEYGNRLGLWEQSDSTSFGGYTYKLEKCALWNREDDTEDKLFARLHITNYLPWAQEPTLGSHLEAVDNLGNRYIDVSQNYTGQPFHLSNNNAYHTAPFAWVMDFLIYAPDFDGVEWIEIRSQTNDAFLLRIDLTGGAAQ